MPFIEAGNQGGHEERNSCPLHRPARRTGERQRDPPGAKQQDAKAEVAYEVADLAYVVIPQDEADRINASEEVKYGIKDAAGIRSGKKVGGLDRNQPQPQNCRSPFFQKLFLSGIQTRVFQRCASQWATGMFLSNAAQSSWLRLGLISGSPLFHGIVGRFPSDHDIVHMALAQPCHANADETSFL